MADKKYNIVLSASDETKAAFESAKHNLEEMDAPLASIRQGMAAISETVAVSAIVEFGKSIVDAAEEGMQAQLKLQAIYKATGGVVGYTAEALNQMADALANTTHFDDEAVKNGMAEIIKFGSITGSVFKDSLKVIADYAAFSKQDFPAAAAAVAKALADPETAAKLLKQAGVVLTETQKELIKSFKDVGDEAGAQRVILDQLQNTYGGMEETLNSGLTGATKSFSKEWHDLLKELGNSSGSVGAAKLVTDSLANTIKSIRESIAQADSEYKSSALFAGGKGAALDFGAAPGAGDKGPLAGKTIADVQAANAGIAGAQKAADEAAAIAAKASLEKLLAQSRKFDEETLTSHDDAFTKWLNQWKKYEDQLTAQGAAGTNARIAHEAAYTSYVTAENVKRLADAAKEYAAKAALLAGALAKENDYFKRLQAMADDATGTATGREKKRYDLQLLDLEKHHKDTVKAIGSNHELLLAEEEAYQVALGNIKKIHQENQMGADQTVAAMAHAFSEGNKQEEISSTASYFEKLSSYGASHSKTMFELNKVASIATAVMNTYKGVSGVLAEFPGPVGWAMAAAQAAMGMAQVAAISSTQFGAGAANAGGAGVPSMATSSGVPVAPQASQSAAPARNTPIINVNLGDALMVPASAVRAFIDLINKEVADGATLITTS